MAIKFANLASTTLASAITSSATTLTVASASGFPSLGAGDYFYASLGEGTLSEIVKVTGISGTTFTITRAQDGTTASSWSSGDTVALRVVAAALDDLAQAADTESVSISGDTMTGTLAAPDIDLSGNALIGGKINLDGNYSNGLIEFQGRDAFGSTSAWLYIDPSKQFTAGIYINNDVRVDGGKIGSYNQDLQLRTGTTTALTLSNTDQSATFAGSITLGQSEPINFGTTNWQIYANGNDLNLTSSDDINYFAGWQRFYYNYPSDSPDAGTVEYARIGSSNGNWLTGNLELKSSGQLTAGNGVFSGTLTSGAITASGTITTTGDYDIRNNVDGDGSTVRDVNWLSSYTNGTADDRVALIRARTRSGASGTRGGELVFYTRDASADSFTAGLTMNSAGGATFAGSVSANGLLKQTIAGNLVDGTYYSGFTMDLTGASTFGGMRFDRNGTAKYRVGLRSDTKFQIANFNLGSGADDQFVIDASGNVGIKNGSPAQALDVTGNAAFSGTGTFNGGSLTVSSGTSGNALLIVEADTDNNNESDLPSIQLKADGGIIEGTIRLNDNTLDIINNVSGAGGIRFMTGTTDNTGTTNPATGATTALTIDNSQNANFAGKVTVNGTAITSGYEFQVNGDAYVTGGTRIANGLTTHSLVGYSSGSNNAYINQDVRDFGTDGAALHKFNRSEANSAYRPYYERWYDGDSYHNIGVSGNTFQMDSPLTVSGAVNASELDLPSGGMLDWASGDARIVEGLVNNYSLSFQTYDGSSVTTALRLDGNNLATFSGGIALGNTDITEVNALSFNDPGPGEGISWTNGNWAIYESPNDLTTNSAGNLQFVSGGSRKVTFDTSGNLEIQGLINSYPLANADWGMTLSSNLSVDITGQKISKNANDQSWNANVRGTIGHKNSAFARLVPNQNNKWIMFGLNSDPSSDASYLSIDYAWYLVGSNSLAIYQNGSNVANMGTYAAGDDFQVVYDYPYIRYLHNGVVKWTTEISTKTTLYFDSSFYSTGADQTRFIDFGPYENGGTEGRLREKFNPSGHYYLGNNDWSHIADVGGSGELGYSAANKGVTMTGSVDCHIPCRIPIDPDAKYRVRVKVTKESGTGTFYCGVVTKAEDFSDLFTDPFSSYNYGVALAASPGTDTVYEAVFGGYNTTSGGSALGFDPEGKYFNIILIANYQGSGVTTIHSLEVERLPLNLHTNNIEKTVTGTPITINSGQDASRALRVYYDMDVYNTIFFTNSSYASQGSIDGESDTLTYKTDTHSFKNKANSVSYLTMGSTAITGYKPFSGSISTSGDGGGNEPFRLSDDYNSWMIKTAGMGSATTGWGLFWAGNNGARYSTYTAANAPDWGASSNPNEFVFVGDSAAKWSVWGTEGNTWQAGKMYVNRDIYSSRQIRATGWYNEASTNNPTGLGAEIGVSGGRAYLLSYNRNTGAYGNLNLEAEGITLEGYSNNATLTVNRYSGQPNIKAGTDDGGYLLMDSTSNPLGLNWYVNQNIIIGNGGGSVGINNSNPGYKLDVNGNARVVSTAYLDGGANVGGVLYSNEDGVRQLPIHPAYGYSQGDATLFDSTSLLMHRSRSHNVPNGSWAPRLDPTLGIDDYSYDPDAPFAGGSVLRTTEPNYFYSDYIPVTPGEVLYGEIWQRYVSGSGGILYYGIERFDSQRRPIAGNTGTTYFAATGVNNTTTEWRKFNGYTQIPTSHTSYNGSDGGGCYWVRVRILINYASSGALRETGGWVLKRVTTNQPAMAFGGVVRGGDYNNGSYFRIEGNNDASGEGTGRIFFAEHSDTTGASDSYGMSLGYRGGATSIYTVNGNTITSPSQIGNGEWGMWGHANNTNGELIMSGDRAATFISFEGNEVRLSADEHTVLKEGGGNAIRMQTNSGYVDIGPMNTSYCHIDTDRDRFYFNRKLVVNSGEINSYDEDLVLVRVEGSAHKMTLSTSGATFSHNVTAYSDERLKESIAPIQGALDTVMKLQGVTYRRIDNQDENLGFIAQQIERDCPEIADRVVGEMDDERKTKHVNYANMVALLTSAIQEQQATIDALTKRIEDLENGDDQDD